MATYRLRVYTGPGRAAIDLGRKVRRAGLRVPTTGTEHIYVDIAAADCIDAQIKMQDALRHKYKKDFGLRPSSCTRRKRSR
jgi:hypothetical protein